MLAHLKTTLHDDDADTDDDDDDDDDGYVEDGVWWKLPGSVHVSSYRRLEPEAKVKAEKNKIKTNKKNQES